MDPCLSMASLHGMAHAADEGPLLHGCLFSWLPCLAPRHTPLGMAMSSLPSSLPPPQYPQYGTPQQGYTLPSTTSSEQDAASLVRKFDGPQFIQL